MSDQETKELQQLANSKDPDSLYGISDAYACNEDPDCQFFAVEDGLHAGLRNTDKKYWSVTILHNDPSDKCLKILPGKFDTKRVDKYLCNKGMGSIRPHSHLRYGLVIERNPRPVEDLEKLAKHLKTLKVNCSFEDYEPPFDAASFVFIVDTDFESAKKRIEGLPDRNA